MGALPGESVSSEDTSGKLISTPLPPTPTASRSGPPFSSFLHVSSLIAHRLMGCPRPPDCLNCPLTIGFASDHSFSAAAIGKEKAKLWEAIKQVTSVRTKGKFLNLATRLFSVTFWTGKILIVWKHCRGWRSLEQNRSLFKTSKQSYMRVTVFSLWCVKLWCVPLFWYIEILRAELLFWTRMPQKLTDTVLAEN